MDRSVVDKPPGGYLRRTFNAGRASMSALDSEREAELRRQVKVAVFGEQPTATSMATTTTSNTTLNPTSKSVSKSATTAKLVKRNESRKLKRRSTPAPSTGKQYITTTYTPPALKPYDTYAPLHFDPFAVKAVVKDRASDSSAPTRTQYGPHPLGQIASYPTSHLAISPSQRTVSGVSKSHGNMYSAGPTVTVKPIHTSPPRAVNGLYSIDEQAHDQDADGAIHLSDHVKSIASYPMYSGLQTAAPKIISQTPRRILNQPRKLSGSGGGGDYNSARTMTTHANKPVYTVRESARTEMRISTWGHHMNDFPTMGSPGSPQSPRTPRLYQRPETLKRMERTPDERFDALPGEILELVLDRLKSLHLSHGSNSCATCWMRDVASISLASRKWAKYARVALYEDIQIVGSDSPTHKKKFKMCQGGRLLLLRRTLRSNSSIAGLVRSLKVPALELPTKGTGVAKAIEQYDDLVSTLVMACPNLEKLAGPFTRYDHTFRKIFHALSTRSLLRQMDWLIEASPAQHKQPRTPKSPTKSHGLLVPESLQTYEEEAWLDLHSNWTELRTLSVHCLPGATLTPTTLLPETLTHLPSLEHLHLCNLPVNAFNDDNLLALPRLKTLTLSHITGVTSTGLSTFATRATSLGLETLTLRHTSLTSLAALARIFSNLSSLKTFSLIQAFSPLMPEGDLFSLWMMPYLASSSLKTLHWDITSIGTAGNAADGILAKSIAAGGFPALRRLRVPNDPDGIFQALCKPEERIDLPSDRFRLQDMSREDSSPPSSPIGIGFLSKSSTATSLTTSSSSSSVSTVPDGPAACSNLRSARLAAQARLEAARCMPLFRVNVTEEGGLVDAFDVAGFIGTLGSPIRYDLRPDVGATDENGGLVDVRDLTGDGGETLVSSNGRGGETAREGCCGLWNRVDGVVADKKERERWWHTERGRWRSVEM